jgi:hypothetical protein
MTTLHLWSIHVAYLNLQTPLVAVSKHFLEIKKKKKKKILIISIEYDEEIMVVGLEWNGMVPILWEIMKSI